MICDIYDIYGVKVAISAFFAASSQGRSWVGVYRSCTARQHIFQYSQIFKQWGKPCIILVYRLRAHAGMNAG